MMLVCLNFVLRYVRPFVVLEVLMFTLPVFAICQKHHITDVTCMHLIVCISQLEGTCLYITRISGVNMRILSRFICIPTTDQPKFGYDSISFIKIWSYIESRETHKFTYGNAGVSKTTSPSLDMTPLVLSKFGHT